MATIYIEATGRHIPAPTYLSGIRTAKANPDEWFKTTLKTWVPGTGAEIMAEYRADLNARINARGGIVIPTGRVSLATWGRASIPRVALERHDIQAMNRHQRNHLSERQRDPRA